MLVPPKKESILPLLGPVRHGAGPLQLSAIFHSLCRMPNKSEVPDTWPKSAEDLRKLYDEFHLQYGETLAQWALLEENLGEIFCWLCGFTFDHPLGRAVFYSGRSFATRADLLSAAIRCSERSKELGELFAAILKKARQLSSSRNVIAHGVPRNFFSDKEGCLGWTIKEGEFSWDRGGIGLHELENAEKNFRLLTIICTRILDRLNSSRRRPIIQTSVSLDQVKRIPADGFVASSLEYDDIQA